MRVRARKAKRTGERIRDEERGSMKEMILQHRLNSNTRLVGWNVGFFHNVCMK